MTNPATVTMSIGLPADTPVVMVFASPSGEFYLDVTTPYRLSGLSHLDNFIMTQKSCPLTGTLQKPNPGICQTQLGPIHPNAFFAIVDYNMTTFL